MPRLPTPSLSQAAPHNRPKVTFDWEAWLPNLEASDASDAEKRQLIETLWTIVIDEADHNG
ncbi:MAG: hypothetical protein AAGL49_12000, partial [Pseudomonadota bacterium]